MAKNEMIYISNNYKLSFGKKNFWSKNGVIKGMAKEIHLLKIPLYIKLFLLY